jgi:hypothetical protein
MIKTTNKKRKRAGKRLEIVETKRLQGKYNLYDATKGQRIIASSPNPYRLIAKASKMKIKAPIFEFIPPHKKINVIPK